MADRHSRAECPGDAIALAATAEPSLPPLLDVDRDGRAAITLRRPRHRNRLHRSDLLALLAQFAELTALAAQGRARVLVLGGQGPVFCAGFHLGEFDDGMPTAAGITTPTTGGAASGASVSNGNGSGSGHVSEAGPALFERCVDALEALPLPTIARVHGGVFGGATDLALACDFRVGTPAAVLRMPAARLGLHYGPNGLRRCVARLGLAATKRLFLLAEQLDAQALWDLGWLDALVPAAALDTEVDARVHALLAGAPLAINGMKQSLDEIARGEFDVVRLREREARCAASADLREGLAAAAERRAPRFQGR